MRLDQVWLRYGVRAPWVLRAVEVDIGPGESAVVLGRNGAGKSTLLQVAAGVLTPTRGVVRDRPGTIGWVPERFPADQPFTVAQYLTGMGRIRALSGPALTRTVDGWIERLGIAPYRDVRLPALSKGTAQKVGLAQALLRSPDLLVLDEPWEGLDGATRELVPELIREVRAAGGAVLVSDHRGETIRLPDAAQWAVADGTVSIVGPAIAEGRPDAGKMSVVEIAVPSARAATTVADLRAAGHHVLRVRPSDVPAPPAASVGSAPSTGLAGPGQLVGPDGADGSTEVTS
ncbi:ATP-binding cassette domain-containing protein [Plantactinospora soyae]|uniref:ABC-type multidrug transport system ATPase subunit n=1 Tax=Plantactinospora soyae TaxID=1544732 RepID=A0A927R359_9ACTN|nr:ABC transporter ATP-binding protein [Plantactinospora soyae]MBE1485174.1 ABC-type multidrug transport system ATPase subunit [Plantactinospora soyae]